MDTNVWDNKPTNADKAKVHVKYVAEKYQKYVDWAVDHLSTDDGIDINNLPRNTFDKMKVCLGDMTTAQAVFESEKDGICALDFASYKEPGGKFIEGSMAQEEALCHASDLYNVLSSKRADEMFYKPNQTRLNKNLYNDNLLYVHDVVFFPDEAHDFMRKTDVIVSAAPFADAARKYCHVSENIINKALYTRIERILQVAKANNVRTLILGAFGCGVFGNDPAVVAKTFMYLLNKYQFETVIFAIPKGRNSANYDAFANIMSK